MVPGEWVHAYAIKKYPTMKALFKKHENLARVYTQTITKIIEMAVESVDSLGFHTLLCILIILEIMSQKKQKI